MSSREHQVNKHLRNSIIHTAEKNSSGMATRQEWNGCVHTTLPQQFYLCSVDGVYGNTYSPQTWIRGCPLRLKEMLLVFYYHL